MLFKSRGNFQRLRIKLAAAEESHREWQRPGIVLVSGQFRLSICPGWNSHSAKVEYIAKVCEFLSA
jgi:hypothetical protein